MNVQYINVSTVKNYLPSCIQFKDPESPQIPVLSETTLALLKKIQNKVPDSQTRLRDVRPLGQIVSDLEKAAKNLEEAKKQETLHKVLSLVAVAVSVTIAAAGVVAFGIGLATGPATLMVAFVVAMMMMGGGLATWGTGAYAFFAFFRFVQDKMDAILSLTKSAEESYKQMGSYVCTYHEKLHWTLSKDLETKTEELAKVKASGSKQVLEVQMQQEIDLRKKALEELEVAKRFYS